MFETPILILGFNRPDRVAELLDRIRQVRPTRLFLAVDGPRSNVASDAERVAQTQELANSVDWPCEVQTLFRSVNLGCGRAVSGAIDWFFDQVEEGIILEDDVLPRIEFFAYCQELLDRYRDEPTVFAISGSNFVPPHAITQDASYRFARITHVWGWATWRRSWRHYRYDLSGWRKRLPMRRRWTATGANLRDYLYWTAILDQVKSGRIDTWDYQLNLAQMSVGGLTATSNVNLVDNMGFRDDATHTERRPAHVRDSEPIIFPLTHPPLEADDAAERWYSATVFRDTRNSVWKMTKKHTVERLASLAGRT